MENWVNSNTLLAAAAVVLIFIGAMHLLLRAFRISDGYHGAPYQKYADRSGADGVGGSDGNSHGWGSFFFGSGSSCDGSGWGGGDWGGGDCGGDGGGDGGGGD